jgi:hypothetical protein
VIGPTISSETRFSHSICRACSTGTSMRRPHDHAAIDDRLGEGTSDLGHRRKLLELRELLARAVLIYADLRDGCDVLTFKLGDLCVPAGELRA